MVTEISEAHRPGVLFLFLIQAYTLQRAAKHPAQTDFLAQTPYRCGRGGGSYEPNEPSPTWIRHCILYLELRPCSAMVTLHRAGSQQSIPQMRQSSLLVKRQINNPKTSTNPYPLLSLKPSFGVLKNSKAEFLNSDAYC